MDRSRTGFAILSIFVLSLGGCGGSGGGDVADQPKMSPQEVQNEIQKLSPPATKGKAKSN
jgi:hypothetical protein